MGRSNALSYELNKSLCTKHTIILVNRNKYNVNKMFL